MNDMPADHRTPWFRVPLVWLLIALPLLSVIGAGIGAVAAYLNPDAEMHTERIDATAAKFH
jgi:hypothetical protein